MRAQPIPAHFTAAEVPAGLDAQRSLGARWVDWLDRLPKLAVDVLTDWELTRTGAPTHGFCSLVLPVRTADGTPTMLKLSLADDVESAYEHLALQAWHPTSVELLRADPRRRAMLLERLDPTDLRSVDDLTACQVVAETYSRLHLPALPQLDLLTDHVGGWLDDLAALPAGAPLPRRLVEHALSRGRDLVADPDSTGVIIHGDLHYENVLSADRGWVVIDPKPMSGDPHYEPAPMLWDRWDELQAGGDVAGGLRRRFATLVDTAGLDLARARDWVVVRMVLNANWTLEDAAGRPLTREQQDWITMCVTVATVIGSDW